MTEKDKKIYYTAFKSKDSRFDGHFFVGISSTGIYCRPVCSARIPKEENCNYYKTAAEAEKSGYRPCLLCRPELAPHEAVADAGNILARKAARLLEESCGSGQSVSELAEFLGCSDRHLRRVFLEEYHVTPVEYVQTCRLLMAKSLLTDTDLSVTGVAMASGFGSLRRFNELFQKKYQLSPTSLRKEIKEGKDKRSEITVGLGYRAPFEWQKILDFLTLRAIQGVEKVHDEFYFRTVRLRDKSGNLMLGWIKVGNKPQKNILTVSVSESLITALPNILAQVRRLFDLYCDPDAVYEALSGMNGIKAGMCVRGIRLPGCMDPFEMSVRAVLGQQITVKAASTLAGRMAEVFGTPIETGINDLTYVFPSPVDIMKLEGRIEDHLCPLGIIATRARTIQSLASMFSTGTIDCSLNADPIKEIKKLMQIPGIGTWTAKYIAMRAIGWTDAFLETDYGVKKALEPMTAKEMLTIAEEWKPWRSYATINLWNSLTEKEE